MSMEKSLNKISALLILAAFMALSAALLFPHKSMGHSSPKDCVSSLAQSAPCPLKPFAELFHLKGVSGLSISYALRGAIVEFSVYAAAFSAVFLGFAAFGAASRPPEHHRKKLYLAAVFPSRLHFLKWLSLHAVHEPVKF